MLEERIEGRKVEERRTGGYIPSRPSCSFALFTCNTNYYNKKNINNFNFFIFLFYLLINFIGKWDGREIKLNLKLFY